MNATNVTAKPKTMKHFFADNFDIPLGVAVITLLAFGFLMVYSASWQYAVGQGNSQYSTVLKQMVMGIIGGGAAIFLTFFRV